MGVPAQALFEEVTDVTALALEADFTVLLELDQARDRLVVRSRWGLPEELVDMDVSTGGTSQAGYTMLTRMPVLSIDTSNDPRFGLPPELVALDPKGALSVLVQSRDGIWGVLVAASRERKRFGANDLRFLQSAGQVLGLSLDRANAEATRDEVDARLDLALGTVNMGIWEYRLSTDTLWASPTVERMLGYEPGGFDGNPLTLLALVPAGDRDELMSTMTVRHGAGPRWQTAFRVVIDGEERWFEVSARVAPAEDGSVDRVVGVAVDATERRRADEVQSVLMARADAARVEAVEARERLGFLASAGARLAEGLDPIEVAQALVDETVGTVADYCVVDLYSSSGAISTAAIGHVDPDLVGLLRETHLYRGASGRTGRDTTHELFSTGHSAFYPEVSLESVLSTAVDVHHRTLLTRIDTSSSVLLPLVARGKLVGGIALGRTRGSSSFDDDDLAMCEQLASRAAVALDNARLFSDRAAVVHSLQETLMPPELPVVAGIQLGARTRVAEDSIEIGGDFYDAFPVADGGTFVVIGDVSGKGPSAAGVTGVVRQVLRAVAPSVASPAAALLAADAVLAPQIDEMKFCTALAARVTPIASGASVTMCNAGHPRPYRIGTGPAKELDDAQGSLLGVLDEPNLTDHDLVLADGESLVLVTDGVTEARRDGLEFGEGPLVEMLSSLPPGLGASEIADRVVEGALAFAEGGVRDDLAVVVIRAARPTPES